MVHVFKIMTLQSSKVVYFGTIENTYKISYWSSTVMKVTL